MSSNSHRLSIRIRTLFIARTSYFQNAAERSISFFACFFGRFLCVCFIRIWNYPFPFTGFVVIYQEYRIMKKERLPNIQRKTSVIHLPRTTTTATRNCYLSVWGYFALRLIRNTTWRNKKCELTKIVKQYIKQIRKKETHKGTKKQTNKEIGMVKVQ